MKNFLISCFMTFVLNIQTAQARVFYDLGDNPILTLFGGSVIFGVIWAIGYVLEEKNTNMMLGFFVGMIKGVGQLGCIGCLISIPINLLLFL